MPDELQGTRVQCPSCGSAFDAAGAPPPLPAQPPPLPHSEPPASPAGQPPLEIDSNVASDDRQPTGAPRHEPLDKRDDTKDEPDDHDDDDRPWESRRSFVRRDCEPHRGGVVLAMGIVSIVLAGPIGLGLGIASWIMGQRDLAKIRQRVMDPAGQGTTQAGWICGIIGTILSSLMTLLCIGYIAFIVFFFNAMSQMTTMKRAPQPTPMPPPPVKKVGMFVPVRPLDYLPSVRP